jgi:transposase
MSENQNDLKNVDSSLTTQALPGYVQFERKKSGVYATYYKSTYSENDSVYHEYEYLGKVIDPDKGIFKSMKRGYFTFNLEDGYGDVEPSKVPLLSEITPNLSLHFGDVWLINNIFKQTGLGEVLDNLFPDDVTTLKSLICFRLTTQLSYSQAEDWYRNSFARVLYPKARLESSLISRLHEMIGQEDVYRRFFLDYLKLVTQNKNISDKVSIPILIDSTGLPNDIKTDLTAVNNHNGVISNEMRLIYVVDKRTKLPIFFRCVPGNIIDNNTLITTINALHTFNVNIEMIIMDAGYCSLDNLAGLISTNISFVTRMPKNRKEYKNLMETHGHHLKCSENHIDYGDRNLYGKKAEITLCGKKLFAYVMLDRQQELADEKTIMNKMNDDDDDQEKHTKRNQKLNSAGKFIILSSDDYEIKDIMPLYYERQAIEEIFDVSKNFASLLPVHKHKNERILGHLLIAFISTIVYTSISHGLKGSKYCTPNALYKLYSLVIKIYESSRVLQEMTKQQKELFALLKVDCPFLEENNILINKDSELHNLKTDLQKKGRGRPKGSKNKIITTDRLSLFAYNPVKHKRGRPKGSKNKK